MADFTANIPKRPDEAPGDAYPGPDPSKWSPYFRKVADDRGFRQSFTVIRVRIETESIVLAIGGEVPSAWTPIGKTETTIAGVKADYTTYQREYGKIRLQRFNKVIIHVNIHLHYMPPTNADDFIHREVWFTPVGKPWTVPDVTETRSKLSSWGAGIVIGGGASIGKFVEIGTEFDFSHEGEDLTPPSGHPTPKWDGLKKKKEDPDVSLEDHAMRSGNYVPFASIVNETDHNDLSALETESIKNIEMGSYASLDIDDIADAVKADEYPGLARFLINKGQKTSIEKYENEMSISMKNMDLIDPKFLHKVE